MCYHNLGRIHGEGCGPNPAGGSAPNHGNQSAEAVVGEDEVAKPAGLFRPDAEASATVRVEGKIRPGLVVALTEEPAGGVEVPTGEPLLTAGVGP